MDSVFTAYYLKYLLPISHDLFLNLIKFATSGPFIVSLCTLGTNDGLQCRILKNIRILSSSFLGNTIYCSLRRMRLFASIPPQLAPSQTFAFTKASRTISFCLVNYPPPPFSSHTVTLLSIYPSICPNSLKVTSIYSAYLPHPNPTQPNPHTHSLTSPLLFSMPPYPSQPLPTVSKLAITETPMKNWQWRCVGLAPFPVITPFSSCY